MADKIQLKLKNKIEIKIRKDLPKPLIACKNRQVADPSLFHSLDANQWELAYKQVMNGKYAKGSRNYSKKMQGCEWTGSDQPPIYVIPRQRGGPSYKKHQLNGANCEDLHYALISKGFPMQDLSSFSLGPIVGEGLCLVNSAFSKCIAIEHIEGGGVVDLSFKHFWKRSSKPERSIELVNSQEMLVNGGLVNIKIWLAANHNLWFDQWDKWRKSVALCGLGDFHWIDDSDCIGYYYKGEFLDFVNWKIECYIRPSYHILSTNTSFDFLKQVIKNKRALGLVHPKGMEDEIIQPLTKEYLKELFDSKDVMCCQPYVIAGKLLGVEF